MTIALTLLSVGLLAAAGAVRSVSRLTREARSLGEVALVAQQELETALARDSALVAAGPDTVRFGGRAYSIERMSVPSTPGVDRIRVLVAAADPPGFGEREPSPRWYATERWRAPPPLLPPVGSGP